MFYKTQVYLDYIFKYILKIIFMFEALFLIIRHVFIIIF